MSLTITIIFSEKKNLAFKAKVTSIWEVSENKCLVRNDGDGFNILSSEIILKRTFKDLLKDFIFVWKSTNLLCLANLMLPFGYCCQ